MIQKRTAASNIGIIGLGRVGLPVSEAFLSAGYQVFGYDKNSTRMAEFKSLGGTQVGNPRSLCKHTSMILLLVLNDEQLLEVIQGAQGVIKGDSSNITLVCMSTVNRETLNEAAIICDKHGAKIVDCPFTGGPARVPKGDLTLIAAGQFDLVESIRPALEIIGNINYAGKVPGLGQAIKHCNQLLVGTTHAATMEVIALARRLGLDPKLVCKVVGEGISGSDYFRLLSASVLEGIPSPGGLGQMCKDVAIVANTAEAAGLPAQMALAAAAYFKEAENKGMQDQEGADLIKIIDRQTT